MFYIEGALDVTDLVRLAAKRDGRTLLQVSKHAGVNADYLHKVKFHQSMRLDHALLLLEASGFRLAAVEMDKPKPT